MPRIKLQTKISAKKEIVFDLSRSIDLHKISTEHTNENAIAGRLSGLIELDETVTWKAKHFMIYQTLTSKITKFDRPNYFVDEMIDGVFKYIRHEHIFSESDNETLLTDIFDYTSPFGVLGNLADNLFLKRYLTKLLLKRNGTIKEFAESQKWKTIINV